LSFLYRDDASVNGCLLTWRQEATAHASSTDLDKRFPNIDKFLTTVKVNLASGPGDHTSLAAPEAVSHKQKWAVLIAKQKSLEEPYNSLPCDNPAMVMAELEVFSAAKKLAIESLQATVVEKVSAWFEKELQRGSPLSSDLHSLSDSALHKDPAFVSSFVALCADYLPLVEQDRRITSLLMELDPYSWKLLCCVRSQWKTQCDIQESMIKQNKEQIQTCETQLATSSKEVALRQYRHETTLNLVNENLATTEMDLKAAQAKAERHEKLSRSLQEELLSMRTSSLQLGKENHPPEANTPGASPRWEEVKSLKERLASSQEALRQAKAAHEAFKTQVQESSGQGEVKRLKEQIEHLKERLANSREALRQAKAAHKASKSQMQAVQQTIINDIRLLARNLGELTPSPSESSNTNTGN
jgi:predicted  nucleic acid-binding Zn-ribbon protein